MLGKKLTATLADWVEHGLISAEQREQIATYESGRAVRSRGSWALYSLLILGVCVLGIGVISLIASNWEEIPGLAKLGCTLLLLTGLGWATYVAHDTQKPIRFDVLATLFIVGCLAAIALIAQLYPTGGEPYQAMIFLLVIITPLVYVSKRGFLPQLWVVAFIGTLLASVFVHDEQASWWIQLVSGGESYHHDMQMFPLFLFIPLTCLALGNLAAHFGPTSRFASAFLLWSTLGALTALVATDLVLTLHDDVVPWRAMVPVVVVGLAAGVSVVTRKDHTPVVRFIQVTLIVLAVVVYLPQIAYEDGGIHGAKFQEALGPAYLIASLLLLAALCAAVGARRLFTLATVVVGIRFLLVYLQVVGSLATTGFGLIVSGLVIIGMALLWYKTRTQLAALIGGLVK